MKILFLSQKNSCRSQIAEAFLRNCDKSLEIYSAGLDPADTIDQYAAKAMGEIGIYIDPKKPCHFSAYNGIHFDYLITVGDGTFEEFELPKINYTYKMHLGFSNPYKKYVSQEKLMERCRETRDEIQVEIDYFYHKILSPKLVK